MFFNMLFILILFEPNQITVQGNWLWVPVGRFLSSKEKWWRPDILLFVYCWRSFENWDRILDFKLPRKKFWALSDWLWLNFLLIFVSLSSSSLLSCSNCSGQICGGSFSFFTITIFVTVCDLFLVFNGFLIGELPIWRHPYLSLFILHASQLWCLWILHFPNFLLSNDGLLCNTFLAWFR